MTPSERAACSTYDPKFAVDVQPMFAHHLLTAAVVAASHVSAFQPGADYDVYKTTNLYNCPGRVPVSNVTARNAADTLPQIAPVAGKGWEQWSLFMHGTFPIVLRWNQGDPSSPAPSPAKFDILLNINGTTVQGTVAGNLSYTDGEHVHKITIGNNVLSWDVDALWYNVSVCVDGYQLALNSFSYVCHVALVYAVDHISVRRVMHSIQTSRSVTDCSTSLAPGSAPSH